MGNGEGFLTKTVEEVRTTSPIFTEASSVTVTASEDEFDRANHSDTQGGYYVEWTPSFDTADVSGDIEILSVGGGADLLYYDATAGAVKSTDGTNTASQSLSVTAGTTYKIGVAYGDSKLSVLADGSWGTEATYDGAFPSGTELVSGEGCPYPEDISDVRRYATDYETAKTTIGAL